MSQGKKKVLLVDDNKTLIMYMSMILNRMGFEVITAENGLEAVRQMQTATPDIILLDITMPLMDGVTTLKKLKKDDLTAEIPVIMISIDSEKPLVDQCERLGCAGFLTKPVRLDKLHDLLQASIFGNRVKRRKYLRCSYSQKVTVSRGGTMQDLYAETISEGGIYIRKSEPFPTGTPVQVTLYMDEAKSITLKGTVIYTKISFGGLFETPLGMAIEFKEITEENAMVLKDYVTGILTKDILEYQEEKVITVDALAH